MDASGRRVESDAVLERIRTLAIPPAWTDVWICPHSDGHLQAVGTDAAGRRQYLYHPEWVSTGDALKRKRMERFALALPAARARVRSHLRYPDLTRDRALAVGFRILDQASVRVGSEQYAVRYATYGLATLRRDHVAVRGTTVRLDFPGKQSKRITVDVRDRAIARAFQQLLSRDDDDPRVLAWRPSAHAPWQRLSSADINAYIQSVVDGPFTAKDFRTWNATVLMAVALAELSADGTVRRRSVVKEAVRRVADHLGNTPAVATRSSIDPRVTELYLDGVTLPLELSALPPPPGRLIAAQTEAAVLEMLRHPVKANRLFAKIERADDPVVVAEELLLPTATAVSA